MHTHHILWSAGCLCDVSDGQGRGVGSEYTVLGQELFGLLDHSRVHLVFEQKKRVVVFSEQVCGLHDAGHIL